MNCQNVKDLILTDYLDEQLGPQQKSAVETHLKECQECRAYLDAVKNISALPFENGTQVRPPEEIWSNIKATIEHEQETSGVLQETTVPGFWQQLSILKRLALGAVSLVLLIIAITTVQKMSYRPVVKSNNTAQIEYFAYLIAEENADDVTEDYGTMIEEYFL
ncbi:MAG: zf-HC2 domain-containing protein [Candidatus Omnitrophica bacterium]|nr:zf-HC2 domain-containing protein [Candidatus Omnitrophota bacterium]